MIIDKQAETFGHQGVPSLFFSWASPSTWWTDRKEHAPRGWKVSGSSANPRSLFLFSTSNRILNAFLWKRTFSGTWAISSSSKMLNKYSIVRWEPKTALILLFRQIRAATPVITAGDKGPALKCYLQWSVFLRPGYIWEIWSCQKAASPGAWQGLRAPEMELSRRAPHWTSHCLLHVPPTTISVCLQWLTSFTGAPSLDLPALYSLTHPPHCAALPSHVRQNVETYQSFTLTQSKTSIIVTLTNSELKLNF